MTHLQKNQGVLIAARRLPLCLLVLVAAMLCSSWATVWAQGRGPAPTQLFQEAEQLYQAHRFADALSRYEQFLQTSPPASQGQQAWLRTAELYGIQGNWQEARRRYEALLTMKTDSGLALQARYGVGQAHYKLNNLPEAERVLENLSASTLPAALRFKTNALLTEISLQTGNVNQAFSRLLLAAKDLSAGEEDWFQDLKTRLLSRATLPELTNLADLYRDTPLSAGVLLQLAKLELQADRPDQAASWLRVLQQRFPTSPEAAEAKQLSGVEPNKPPASPGAVGCLLPLSGEDADAGGQVQSGVELAAAQTGVPIIVQDCGSRPDDVAAAVNELGDNPEIIALLGFFPSAAADAAAEAAQRLGLPLLALTQKKDVTLGRPLVFRDFLTHRLMLQALVHHTTATLGLQRFAILYPDSKYGQTLARQFGDEINRQAARLVGQASYQEGGADVVQAVRTLAQIPANLTGGPAIEAIFIPDEAAVLAAAAQELALTPLHGVRLLGTNLLQTPATLKYSDVLANTLFVDAFAASDPEPLAKAFSADFRARYQKAPGYLAAQGYSSMRLLAETIRQNPSANRQELAADLQQQGPPPGFSLFKRFDHERQAEVATRIITIRQGQFVVAP